MRRIAVVTVGRSDLGYLMPVIREIANDGQLELQLIVTGTHLAPEFGFTVREIETAAIPIADRVDMLLAGDAPSMIAKSVGVGVIGLAQSFKRLQPDILVLLGDRFETLAAACAFLPFARPIAHIAGGESSEGAIDDSIRHAITKMSCLHFVSTESHARRVLQMGEERWRVFVTGAPTLDNLRATPIMSREELESLVAMSLEPAPVLVTLHPTTLRPQAASEEVGEVMSALEELGQPVLFTYPNADANGRIIIEAIQRFVAAHANARVVVSLGTSAYHAAMRAAALMLGNSSSGIIEAASFGLPVVDIGERQRGRECGDNVIHASADRSAIVAAAAKAMSEPFRRTLLGLQNPYGDGHAAERIVAVLRDQSIDERLLQKRFQDRPQPSEAVPSPKVRTIS